MAGRHQSRIATGVRSGHKVELRDAPEPFFKQDAQFPPRERRAQTNVDATDKGEVTAMSSIIPVTTARMLPCILLRRAGEKNGVRNRRYLRCSGGSMANGMERKVSPFRAGFHSEQWWARQDSNPQPSRYERPALTIELQAPPDAGDKGHQAALQARPFWDTLWTNSARWAGRTPRRAR